MEKLHSKSKVCSVAVICIFSIVHWMDRYTLASVLPEAEAELKINEDGVGLLFTVFVVCNTMVAPLFGYLGDRWNRRYLLIFGMFMAGSFGFLGSFADNYWLLLASRGFMGIGHAPWLVLSPAVISDLYEDRKLMIAMTLYFEGIPLGIGLGFVFGSQLAVTFKSWRYALRYTIWLFIIGMISFLLIEIPHRGGKPKVDEDKTVGNTYGEDVLKMLRNKTFWLITLVLMFATFQNSSVSWWSANYMYHAFKLGHAEENWTSSKASLLYSVVLVTSGMLALPIGGILSQRLTPRMSNADPLIVGVGLLLSLPFMAAYIYFAPVASFSIIWLSVVLFAGMLLINLNWPITTKVTLQVVMPTRRGTALAVQLVFVRLLGEAISPYIVGVLSLELQKQSDDKDELSRKVYCLRNSLFIVIIAIFLAGVLSLLCMRYINEDRKVVVEPRKEDITRKSVGD